MMIVPVFALGRPGSGKSTAAHHLSEVAWEWELSAIRVGDFKILQQMFHSAEFHRCFSPTAFGGFDVTDFSVLPVALKDLKHQVEQRMKRLREHEDQLIIIEFARDNYEQALDIFGGEFIKQAFFIYVDAPLDACIGRIQERVQHPQTPDDHFVSEEIMRNFYAQDDGMAIRTYLRRYGVPDNRVFIIDNSGPSQRFCGDMKRVTTAILDAATAISQAKLVGAPM